MNEEKDIRDFAVKSDMYSSYMRHKEFRPISNMQQEIIERSSLYLEFLAAAYIKEVGIPASECELVIHYGIDTIKFQYRKRQNEFAP